MARAKNTKVKPVWSGVEPRGCEVEGCGGVAVLRLVGVRTGLTRFCCADRKHVKAVERTFNEGVAVTVRRTTTEAQRAAEDALPRLDSQLVSVEDASRVVVQSDPASPAGLEAASDTSTAESPAAQQEVVVVADGPVGESLAEPMQPGNPPETEPRDRDGAPALDHEQQSAAPTPKHAYPSLMVWYVQPNADRASGAHLIHVAMVTATLGAGDIVNLCVFNSAPADQFDCVSAVLRARFDATRAPGTWHYMSEG